MSSDEAIKLQCEARERYERDWANSYKSGERNGIKMEKKNTEREKKRADEAEARANKAEERVRELEAKLNLANHQ